MCCDTAKLLLTVGDSHRVCKRSCWPGVLTAAAASCCPSQGIGISAINSMGKISDPEDGQALQNFMICCEMALAGIALLYAFPHKEYQIGGSTSGFKLESFTHAISIHDVVKDAIHVVSMPQ